MMQQSEDTTQFPFMVQNTYWELDSSDIQCFLERAFPITASTYDVIEEQGWLNHHAYPFDARPERLTRETRKQYRQDVEHFLSGVPFTNDLGEEETVPLDSLLLHMVEQGLLPSGLYLITACF